MSRRNNGFFEIERQTNFCFVVNKYYTTKVEESYIHSLAFKILIKTHSKIFFE